MTEIETGEEDAAKLVDAVFCALMGAATEASSATRATQLDQVLERNMLLNVLFVVFGSRRSCVPRCVARL